MFILHIALQGCLRARDVSYGLTPDTGGHIKYLLELVQACDARALVQRQQIVVRRFHDSLLGDIYGEAGEQVSEKTDIVRLPGAVPHYLSKEELYRERALLADNLERHIRSLNRWPDVIHAHYADAGWLAAQMKERLGIAYVFTAHSLGRVKQRAMADRSLDIRIAMEDYAVVNADLIIASSIDESEHQYATYPDAAPERLRVNPPGCDLAHFAPGSHGVGVQTMPSGIAEVVDACLAEPEKPCILALSRPVPKKNLEGLVAAYAHDTALQEAANLVIFAGTWDDLDKVGSESRAVLQRLEALVGAHGLEGRVAMPKRHEPDDVPAIYAYARKRRGVFANVAFNEPFGLTFLEAAAAGVPVVATRHGGPNDILARLQNGLLVDPKDTAAIAAALRDILCDHATWDAMAARGQGRVGYYSWDRHAQDYLADLAAVIEVHGAARAPARQRYRRLLVCDIDNTLTGCRAGLEELRGWLAQSPDTAFAFATGRSLNSAQEVVANWDIPQPCVWITSVGSEIYWPKGSGGRLLEGDNAWRATAAAGWDRAGAEAVLAGLPWLQRQDTREQRDFKLSYFLDDAARVPQVQAALDEAGIEGELIYSHGRFLDLLPRGISKGHAIAHVAERLGVEAGQIAGAGDSGNDLHMLRMVAHPIVVANHTDELSLLRQSDKAYFAAASHAGGVLEGVRRMNSAMEEGDGPA